MGLSVRFSLPRRLRKLLVFGGLALFFMGFGVFAVALITAGELYEYKIRSTARNCRG